MPAYYHHRQDSAGPRKILGDCLAVIFALLPRLRNGGRDNLPAEDEVATRSSVSELAFLLRQLLMDHADADSSQACVPEAQVEGK